MPKQSGNEKIQKKWTTLISVGLFFVAIFLFNAAFQDVRTTVKLKNEISSSKAEIKSLTNEKDKLAQEKANMEDSEYVTRFARGKFMVSKEGEQVFILPNKSDDMQE